MIKNIQYLGNPNGTVAAGSTLSMPIPPAGVIHGIFLVCRKAASAVMSLAEIIADIDTISLRVDGDLKIESTPQRLIDIFKYYFDKDGAHTVAGTVPIPLGRPIVETAAQQALLGYGTADVTSISLQIKVKAIATLVSVEVYIEQEDAIRKLGRHICVVPFIRSFASTGQQDISDLPYGDVDKGILAIHLGESTGDIDQINVKAGYASGSIKDIFEKLTMELNAHNLKRAGRTQQTDNFHIDFTQMNDTSAYLPSGSLTSLRIQPTWETAGGAPGNFVVMVEEIRGFTRAVA